jgi:hypothetical protein
MAPLKYGIARESSFLNIFFILRDFWIKQLKSLNSSKKFKIFFGGIFFSFCSYSIQHCFICRPSDSTVPTDAGIEPWTVATGALAVRRSNH